MTPPHPSQSAVPPAALSREDQARVEIGHTEIGPVATWTLVIFFLVAVFAVPVIQAGREWRFHRAGQNGRSWLQAGEIVRAFPAAAAAWRAADGGPLRHITQANAALLQSLHKYEDELEQSSFLREQVLPPAQLLMASAGAGNEKAYLGRDGWLFYRPEIDLLAGPGFLDKAALARRAQGGNEWQPPIAPDPRPAILDFHRQLAARGIRLVLLLTPVKATIHPEKFSARPGDGGTAVLNSSHETFCREMEQAGVVVFDPTATLMAEKRAGAPGHSPPAPQFLATDTHWRPEAMDRVTAGLARLIGEKINLPASPARFFRAPLPVTGTGDIAQMLQLPPGQRLFPPESVTIQQVRHASGEFWSPDPKADVLLLGDSFANIYSLEEMKWGRSAGLAEQISFHLGRPLDAILRNDAGAFATRQMLATELARGHDRLAGKKIVIWEFAARELSSGDWKLIQLPQPPALSPAKPVAPGMNGDWFATVSGVITQTSEVPGKGVTYKDHIRALHVTGLEAASGTVTERDAVVYVWSMRDREFTPEARLRAGDRVTFRVQPWDKVSSTLGRINRSELDDPDLLLRPAWWGEAASN
jgi:hypothetical protein